jgi:hypothetical protein
MPAAFRTSLAVCALFMLAACGGGSPAPVDEATEAAEQAADEALGRDTDATVLDDMIQTQDRARGVEDLTLGRKDDLDQALEASGDDTAVDEE